MAIELQETLITVAEIPDLLRLVADALESAQRKTNDTPHMPPGFCLRPGLLAT